MADYSKCLECSATYGNFFKKHSGKIAVSFCITTAAAGEKVYGRDPTIGLTGGTVFWLEYLQMQCGSQTMMLYDGSLNTGTRIAGPIGDNSMAGGFLEWDLRKDPIACLTADNTSSLSVCISTQTSVGFGSLYLEGYWGVI